MKYLIVLLVAVVLGGSWYLLAAPDRMSREGDSTTAPSPADDTVVLTSPRAGDVISSPLEIIGDARGYWFFEGDAPVTLTDWDGRIIAEGYITAQSDWMTEDYVPFRGILTFTIPDDIGAFSNRGSLILRKDNPSDLPEHDDAREIVVRFR